MLDRLSKGINIRGHGKDWLFSCAHPAFFSPIIKDRGGFIHLKTTQHRLHCGGDKQTICMGWEWQHLYI
jgi:hypothetical protein